jgi:two-component system OmpR family response regulator
MRILLIEDSPGLGAAIQAQLIQEGHALDWMQTLAHAQASLQVVDYELILLDLMLPDGSGIDLLNNLRQQKNSTPVIILTAKDQISDRIKGLNAGADDYLVKPFDLSELSARIAAVTRRYAGHAQSCVQLGEFEINSEAHVLRKSGVDINLTAREWAILDAFIRRPQRLLSKAQLEDCLYAFGAEIESNTIEVYISRLRKKLGRDSIETVRGMGYKMVLEC